jgi:hypothetical protein
MKKIILILMLFIFVGVAIKVSLDLVFIEMMDASGNFLKNVTNVRQISIQQSQMRQKLADLGLPFPVALPDYFLNEDQLALARSAIKNYPLMLNDTNQTLRREMLAGFNEEQMIYFKSEFERYGPTIKSALMGFIPTQNEFYRMVQLMQTNSAEDLMARLSDILSASRYEQFKSIQTPLNVVVNGFCEKNPALNSKRQQMLDLIKNRAKYSEHDFRAKAINLVGPEFFEEYIALKSD